MVRRGPTQRRTEKIHLLLEGKSLDQPRIHDVGFAIRNYLVSRQIEQPVGVNERLMTLRIQLDKNQYATLISAYEPTLDADDEVKEAFYTQLSQIMISTLERDKLIVLEDFNC